ncbi:glycine cleavage system aminomethyltransferase GcvT [Candidatus Zixiibacteriota bacterium]
MTQAVAQEMDVAQPKKTPFYDLHLAAGAKMVEFAGYLMPVQYTGIIAEHRAVRESVGIFDLSHMGEFEVSGPGALAFLQKMTTNDVATLEDYKIQYSILCYDNGGIVDDLLVYKLPDRYFLVVNGANIQKDFDWLEQHRPADVVLQNISDRTGLLAIQGPRAPEVMAQLTDYDLDNFGYYWCAEAEICGRRMLFSRTGYTGEDGFEIYCSPDDAAELWERTWAAGQQYGMARVGLGARDSLRLEMKYALYGNDIDRTTNPIEAGLGWVVKAEKGDFIGREPILKTKAEKPARRLVCFIMKQKAIPRQGYKLTKDGREVGVVTSGIHSPSLGQGIGLAYVERGFGKIGAELYLDVRGRSLACEIVKPPFYKNGTHR